MAAIGLEQRLLTHHAIAIDMVYPAMTVSNFPMPGQQLDGIVAVVFDADMVRPEPAVLRGARLLIEKIGDHADGDALSRCMFIKKRVENQRPTFRNA